jgi:serine protease Do
MANSTVWRMGRPAAAVLLASLALVTLTPRRAVAATKAANKSATAGEGRELIQPAIDSIYPALVKISVVFAEPSDGRMRRAQASGSGAIVSADGYVVTNHHVAGDATRMICSLSSGEEIEAVRIGTDPMADIAVLKLKLKTRKHPELPLAVAKWGDSDKTRVGDVVLAMGCPMAVSQSVTKGIVSNTQLMMPRYMEGSFRLDGEDVGQIVRWIGHDAVIYGGNSGGPLVNLQGEIIGINEVSLGSLGGAIPSNLARQVVAEIIKTGHVTRSWTGLEFQHRLKSGKSDHGVLIGGVIPGSPAEKAGLRPGDLLVKVGDKAVNAELPEHLAAVNQIIMGLPVGQSERFVYVRDGKEHTAKVKTELLQRALGDAREIKEWGLAGRDITRMMALERHRESTSGVLVDSVRAGGAAANAKLPLEGEDVIVEVGGRKVENFAALKEITAKILAEKKAARASVLVEFERKKKRMVTVVKVGSDEPRSDAAKAKKPWSSLATQVVTADLAGPLGLKNKHGVRITEVYQGQAGEKAGFKVGDIIVAVDGSRLEVAQPEDAGVFDLMLRRKSIGDEAAFDVLRDGKPLVVKMKLEAPAESAAGPGEHKDADFEFNARDLTYQDRISQQLPASLHGVIVTKVENGGWASLGGLRPDDIVLEVDGKLVASIDELKPLLAAIRREKPRRVVFLIRRGIHSRFCEIEPDYH